MNNEELYNYINFFRDKALNNKLIIFVGSGVSRNVDGMPSWFNLVDAMAKEIGYSKCNNKNCDKKDNCDHITDCPLVKDLSTDEFLKIPQYLFNDDRDKYNKILKENIQHPKVNAPLSDVIFDANPVHIITTNYDRLLEDSENELREQYQVVIRDEDLLTSDKSKYIIKMHGDITDEGSIVLREENYLNYSQEHILIELFVKSLLVDHTILFLGYSLSDYNIKLIINWINYMRTQSKDVLSDSTRIGYIILDENEIDERQIKYFRANNIDVVNINKISVSNDIPSELKYDKGKRLYSFVKMISEPSLEETVLFLSQHKYVNYRQILSFLKIDNNPYDLCNGTLQLFYETEYNRITSLMGSDDSNGEKLRKLFLNAGITKIVSSKPPFNKVEIGKFNDISLFGEKLFNLYLYNKYDELYALIQQTNIINVSEKCFYLSIVCGYAQVQQMFETVDCSEFSPDDKVAYLHNDAALKCIIAFKFNSNKIEKYINNLSSSRERKFYTTYLDIFNGNPKALLKIKKTLDALKKAVNNKNSISIGRPAYHDIFTLKEYAYSQYFFYFVNKLFFIGFKDLQDFLRPYIEGIICANSEIAEMPSSFWGEKILNYKYPLEILDIDLISKFLKAEDLQVLLSTYKIIKLNTSENTVNFLVECFTNLTYFITRQHVYGYQSSTINTISNLALLLCYFDFNCDIEAIIIDAFQNLFLDKDFCQFLFSGELSQWKNHIKAFSTLGSKLHIKSNYAVIQNIIASKGFIGCLSVNLNLVREMVLSFVNLDDFGDVEPQVIDLIENNVNVKDKILLLHIFFRYISDNNFKRKTTKYLSNNFKHLDITDIFEFMDGNWIGFSDDDINWIFDDIIALAKRTNIEGINIYPDALENQLFKIYVLYLEDVIKDVSRLSKLSGLYTHLDFLINPKSFDYTQVDFTDYMWKNFVRYEKTRSHFIAHKDVIIKYLKEKLRNGTITESEKEILFRFFLSDDENLLN